MQGRKRIAVVGSGAAGLAAVWALQRTEHEVHLFEAADRLGGHTNTVSFQGPDSRSPDKVDVDTGFIVMNTATYPNFIRFLAEVGVPTVPTDMTFGVSRDQGAFEWAGTSLASLFAQKRNFFSPRLWRMVFDIIRFNQFALDLLAIDDEDDVEDEDEVLDRLVAASSGKGTNSAATAEGGRYESIGSYLDREGYSTGFREDYLIPMTAAVWSTTPDKCALDFPAVTLARFMWNHHLLSTVTTRPAWLTIPGGSRRYIDAVMAKFPAENVHLDSPVDALFRRADGQIILKLRGLRTDIFDHVILAVHGDQAAAIMRGVASPAERAVLAGFRTSRNEAVLHSDAAALMPRRRAAYSSWNYITTSDPVAAGARVCLTYSMNILQHLDEARWGPVLVTLNPVREPDPHTVQGRFSYEHPLYDAVAVAAQRALPLIQNARGISYAGAWTGYGFHEDAFTSGLAAAFHHLGATLPFKLADSTYSRGRRPVLTAADHLLRIVIRLIQISLLVLGIFGAMLGLGSRGGSSNSSSRKIKST